MSVPWVQVLLDIVLPGLNGVQLLRRIHNSGVSVPRQRRWRCGGLGGGLGGNGDRRQSACVEWGVVRSLTVRPSLVVRCSLSAQHKALQNVPIFMLTAFNSADLVTQCASLGARGHLYKPLTPEKLQGVIRAVRPDVVFQPLEVCRVRARSSLSLVSPSPLSSPSPLLPRLLREPGEVLVQDVPAPRVGQSSRVLTR